MLFPTATEPPIPMMNGTLKFFFPKNKLVASNNFSVPDIYKFKRREIGKYTSLTSSIDIGSFKPLSSTISFSVRFKVAPKPKSAHSSFEKIM